MATRRRLLETLTLSGYVFTIWFANWLITVFGIVPVGFGLTAPAGVYAAGAALALRDVAQETAGRHMILLAIAVGVLISLAIAPQFAVASAVAFGLSECADFAVYTPLRDRGRRLLAVGLSGTVGAVVDSVVFLLMAFGSLEFLTGQVVGKTWITLAAVGVMWLGRAVIRWWPRIADSRRAADA